MKLSKLSAFVAGALSLSLVNADTTADYAQDGLVACWDGYENDGAGVHSAAELSVPVAAPVALTAEFGQLIEITSGNDDDATINAAIQSAPEGAVVHLADGTYNLTAPIVLDRPVTLVGNVEDRTKVVLDGAGAYRLLEVSDEQALACWMTFERGRSGTRSNNNDPAPVHITAGTVSSCICHDCDGDCAGGVTVYSPSGKTAIVKDTLISDCEVWWVSGGIGGGLRLGGSGTSIADGCVISNSTCQNGGNYAVVLCSSSAKLLNSTVVDCPKGGVYIQGNSWNAVVSNCVVSGCSRAGDGAGVYNNSGTVIDSLVVGNSSTAGSGGGIYNKGTVVGCTVVGNTATGSGSGVYQSGGTLKDSIVWYNGSTGSMSEDQSLQLAGGNCNHTCATLAGDGEGNITDRTPAFVDLDGGDYRLTAASPCRGTASDGADMGCFQFVPSASPRASFTYALVDGVAPVFATFTAAVEGATALKYVWDFGDGEPVETVAPTVVHEFTAVGKFSVTLTVKTAGGDLTYAVPNAVTLAADTVYVSKSGSNTFPYSDWTTAATDIQAAVDAVACSDDRPGRVCLADDTYDITEPIVLNKAVELVGNETDRSKVVLDGGGTSRLVEVKYGKALVRNLTFANGHSSSKLNNGSDPAPVHVTAGTVSSCICHDCNGDCAGGVTVYSDSGKTAALRDTLVFGCQIKWVSGGVGGGLRLNGSGTSIADGCVISNCTCQNGGNYAVRLVSSGSKLLNSTVVDCPRGGITVDNAGSVVSNCVVRNCSRSAEGAGIYNSGIVRDSLVVGNSSTVGSGGGIYNRGTVVGCTVVGNTAVTSGPGVYQASGSLRDSIVWYNGTSGSLSQDKSLMLAGGTCTYTCAIAAGSGTGNLTDKLPAFVDQDGGDYRLTAASPCRGAASDGADMGCFQFDPSSAPSASFDFTIVDGTAPATTTFAAAVEGATATKYVWDFGDGELVETDGPTVTHTFAAAGQYSVTLTVRTAGGDLVYAVQNAVTLAPNTVYVSTTGSNTFPYSDWATAATDIRAAVEAVICSDARPGKVYVADGTYPVAEALELDRAIEIIGNDADRTQVVLDGGGTSRLAEMKHEQAFVHGLTFANGKSALDDDNSSHGPVNIHCGTVSNCVCRGFRGTYCGALSLNADNGKAAVVKDTFIYDCFCDYSTGSIGGGLRFNGKGTSLADGCVVSNCQDKLSFGVAVRAANARFVNSLVVGCTRGGIYQTAGLVDRCRILGNSSDSSYSECAGVYLTGGTIRNCLVAGNTSTKTASGIRANGAVTVENCTVADNEGKDAAGLISESASVTWRNTLSWNNRAGEAVNPDVVTPETPGTFDHCLTGVDPVFRSPAKGNYHVRGGSPARNGGVKAAWMDGATDLEGSKRILDRCPDVGCYEDTTRGLMLLVQ